MALPALLVDQSAAEEQGDMGSRNSSQPEYLPSLDANHHSGRSSMLACFEAQA